ncbi:hypothetical protein C2869_06565 [Saccharobesus litoralis]|uniref:MYXO-CTERM domain-containing protein n=1 Tax=Saccharobesus litoralis TaxID=2172099 RepID=A0A2S0VPK4_9ALTE|nr:hypothetical protein [Saccharobesus litoralis]AWB66123.1 hypothetical protein C2869_06565 [Saccharobesus litoralis]
MKTTMMRVVAFTLVTLPTLASAHSGHDHSAPESGLIHLAWLAPLVIAGAVIFIKRRNNSTDK